VVFDVSGFALYFSRAPIPFDRNLNSNQDTHVLFNSSKEKVGEGYYRHLGLYAYRVKTLKQYRYCWTPVTCEGLECLEQLRILWNGEKIHVSVIEEQLPPGVDTVADLEKVRLAFSKEVPFLAG
jgi:3-deoxy-manno-octulosonate cytidylyltransferase (CMP-KDO synthetase)